MAKGKNQIIIFLKKQETLDFKWVSNLFSVLVLIFLYYWFSIFQNQKKKTINFSVD